MLLCSPRLNAPAVIESPIAIVYEKSSGRLNMVLAYGYSLRKSLTGRARW